MRTAERLGPGILIRSGQFLRKDHVCSKEMSGALVGLTSKYKKRKEEEMSCGCQSSASDTSVKTKKQVVVTRQ